MANQQDIVSILRETLKSSPYWSDKTKETGRYFNSLICPVCGKPEAFAFSDRPFSLFCHRNSQCGCTSKCRDLFPEIFINIEKTYKPTKEDPNLPATTYLGMRGLQTSLAGLSYEYWPDVRKSGSGAVMFPIYSGDVNGGKPSWNGRLFNPPDGEGKTHNQGKTKGLYWRHPGMEYDTAKETFVTEGILDALSLIELGFQAIAVLASGQDPRRVVLTAFKRLVFAFDNDTAGHRALKSWLKTYPGSSAIMPDAGGDWNDFLNSTKRYRFADKRKGFEFNAKLAAAPDAKSYAEAWVGYKDCSPGLFVFDGGYWYGVLKRAKTNDEIVVFNISNFTLTVDHYQLTDINKDEPSNRYYLKVKPKIGRSVFCVATADDLHTPQKMKRMFLDRARVHWKANTDASEALSRIITESKNPVVRQLYIAGYDEPSQGYYNKWFMIDPTGRKKNISRQGYFKVSPTEYIRPANYQAIRPVATGTPCTDIYKLIYQAWGERGMAMVAWCTASWFVRQIKLHPQCGFFPILSLYGDTQTGKTLLTRFCNALQCLDEEGLPMRQANTAKGEIRKIAQRSGLFKALLEWPMHGRARFDLDAITTLYNEAPLQVRAIKTNDYQTEELSFLGSLVFVQNREPFVSRPQKERVISLRFRETDLNEYTTEAIRKMGEIPLSNYANFLPTVMKHRQEIEAKWFGVFERARAELDCGEITTARVRDNHAIIYTFHSFLSKIFGEICDIEPYIRKIAVAKHRTCCYVPATIADHFLDVVLDMYDDAESRQVVVEYVDLRETEKVIWVYLPAALKAMKDTGNISINLSQLYDELRVHPSYIDSNKQHKFNGKNKKGWKFCTDKIVGEKEFDGDECGM